MFSIAQEFKCVNDLVREDSLFDNIVSSRMDDDNGKKKYFAVI